MDSTDFASAIKTSVANCSRKILLASAFVKVTALDKMVGSLGEDIQVTVVARWQLHDLSFGASDLEVYEYCRARGYKFGMSLNFHGKVYAFDERIILLGSANLTSRGLSLSSIGNTEFGTLLVPRVEDSERLEQFINSEVVWVDDILFELIAAKVTEAAATQQSLLSPPAWPASFQKKLTRPIQYLWVEELVICSPHQLLQPDFNNDSIVRDFNLLGLSIDELSRLRIIEAFLRTRQYSWLVTYLAKRGSSSFGAISSALHNSVLDDPAPYRKSVKDFVRTLFEWAEYIPEHFVIERYNHTASIDIIRA